MGAVARTHPPCRSGCCSTSPRCSASGIALVGLLRDHRRGVRFAADLLALVGLADQGWAQFLLRLLGVLLGLTANFLVFLWVIARLPRQHTPIRSAVKAAVLGAVGFEVLKQVMTIYLSSITNTPSGAVFGSLLGLLVFINFVSRFILFVTAWAATTKGVEKEAPAPIPAPAVIRPEVVVRSGPNTATTAGLLGMGAVTALLGLRAFGRRRCPPRRRGTRTCANTRASRYELAANVASGPLSGGVGSGSGSGSGTGGRLRRRAGHERRAADGDRRGRGADDRRHAAGQHVPPGRHTPGPAGPVKVPDGPGVPADAVGGGGAASTSVPTGWGVLRQREPPVEQRGGLAPVHHRRVLGPHHDTTSRRPSRSAAPTIVCRAASVKPVLLPSVPG